MISIEDKNMLPKIGGLIQGGPCTDSTVTVLVTLLVIFHHIAFHILSHCLSYLITLLVISSHIALLPNSNFFPPGWTLQGSPRTNGEYADQSPGKRFIYQQQWENVSDSRRALSRPSQSGDWSWMLPPRWASPPSSSSWSLLSPPPSPSSWSLLSPPSWLAWSGACGCSRAGVKPRGESCGSGARSRPKCSRWRGWSSLSDGVQSLWSLDNIVL